MKFMHKPILAAVAALGMILAFAPQAPAQINTPAIQSVAFRNNWLIRRQMILNQLRFNQFVYGNAFGPNAAYYSLFNNNLYNNNLNNVLRLNRLLYGSNMSPYAAYMYGGYPMSGGYNYNYNYNYSSPPTYQSSPYSSMGYYPSLGSAAAANSAPKSIPHYTPEPNPSFARSDVFKVEIHDMSVSHATVTIPPGTAVEFTNAGRRPHTVAADDGTWRTTLQPDESFSFKFTQPGTHRYHVDAKSDKIDGSVVVKK